MGTVLSWLRLCALAIFITIPMASGPCLADGQKVDLDALEKEAREFYEAGRYAEALADAEKYVATLDERERANGRPAVLIVRALTRTSWYALFAHQPEKALEASERALKIDPRFIEPATNRAHALLFLDRPDEARAAYAGHKGEPVSKTVKWEDAIAGDFAEFRKRGLTHPMLSGMEQSLAAASPSGKTELYVPEDQQKMWDEIKKLIGLVPQMHMARRDAEALPLAERLVALSEATAGPENTMTANNVGALGDVLAGLGRNNEAEAACKRNIATLERNGRPIDLNFLPHRLLMLANLYIAQQRYAEAEPLLKRAIGMREAGNGPENSQQTGILLDALGKLYVSWGLYAEAEQAFNRALTIVEAQAGAQSPLTGAVLNNLAQLYATQGKYADAERVMLRAIATFGKDTGIFGKLLSNINTEGPMLGNLGEIYQAQGRYGKAEELFKRSLALAEGDRDKANLVLALNNLAGLYSTQGRFAESEPLLKRSLDVAGNLPGGGGKYDAALLNNLAALYHDMGRQSEAEALYRRGLALRLERLGPDHPDVALSMNNLAVYYHDGQRYAEAEELVKQAQAIREKTLPPDHPDIATGLDNLAEIFDVQKRHGEAEPLMLRALAIREKALGPKHKDIGTSYHNLAGVYQGEGRLEEAAQAYKRSLAIWESALGPDHPLVATGLNNTAELYFKQQDWAQAASYWQRSTDILIRRFKHGAGAAHGGGMPEIDQEASRFRRMVRVSYRTAGAEPTEAKAISARMFEAAQWAEGSAAAQSLAQMAARKAAGAGELGKLVREQQDLGAEWQVKDKLLTAARSKAEDQRDQRVEAELHDRLAAIDTRLAEIAAALAKDFPDYATFASPEPLSLAETQRYLRDNEALLLFLDAPAKEPLPEETFIWVVTKTDERWVRVAIGTPTLEREVKALRCGLDYEGAWGEGTECPALTGQNYSAADEKAGKPLPFDAKRAHALYKGLFAKVEDLIKGKRLLIAASGPLSQLPFQVLVTEAPRHGDAVGKLSWLIRKHSIAVLPAVSSLKALRWSAKAQIGGKPYLGVGNPLLEGQDAEDAALAAAARNRQSCPKPAAPGGREAPKQSVPAARQTPAHRSARRSAYMQGGHVDANLIRMQEPLPETAGELCMVAKDLNAESASVLLGANASETKLKGLSEHGELASYGILHFATHGALAGQIGPGAEPGLLLTPPETASELDDGYLSASEIVNLKLNADWVILSACNTAAGGKDNSEALSGLARSFFYAGARSMLVSHWAVNSQATVKLVTRAVTAMKANPEAGRAEALQKAMLGLIAKDLQPALWAPFVVAGEGGR